MIFSQFFKNEMQMSKFGRLRMNYNQYEKVIQAKEIVQNYQPKPNHNLKIRTVIGF